MQSRKRRTELQGTEGSVSTTLGRRYYRYFFW